MKPSRKNSIAKFSIFVVMILLFSSTLLLLSRDSGVKQSVKGDVITEMPEFLSILNRRWENGDLEKLVVSGKNKCADIPSDPSELTGEMLKCNDAYLKCVLTGNVKEVTSVIKTLKGVFRAKKNSFRTGTRGDLIIDFMEKNSGVEFSTRLEHFCHSRFLPEKIYSAGADPYGEDVWDNYGRKLFIDTGYALHANSLKPILDLKGKKEYCYLRGKTLLQSHIFDAASFFPTKYEYGFMFKSYFPWGKSREIKTMELQKKDCERIYTKECEKLKLNYLQMRPAIGWLGVYHTLGSEVEQFENLFHEDLILKKSNKSLERKNSWHRNGKRSRMQEEQISLGVAFRCLSIK
jgi:hypothetical protein